MSSAHRNEALAYGACASTAGWPADASILGETATQSSEIGLSRAASRLKPPRVALAIASPFAWGDDQPRIKLVGARNSEWAEAALSFAFLAICWASVEVAIVVSTGEWWRW